MIIPGKVLLVIAAAAAATAGVAEAEGVGHLVSAGLSLGAIASAVGAFYVTREKAHRNEKDIEKVGSAVEDLGRRMQAAFTEHRAEIREDLREHRDQTRETIQQLVHIVNGRADQFRAGDRL